MRVLVFGTFRCTTAADVHRLEQWATALQRIAPGMDQLIVDWGTPAPATAAHRFPARFGPRLSCAGEPAPMPVGDRSIIGFSDDVGRLESGGRDGWGRAFSQGLLCAMAGGYDYVVHIAGDLLTRLDLAAVCGFMKDRDLVALGTTTPLQGRLETGLLMLRVDFLRQSRLVDRYDWRRRSTHPPPAAVLSELLGGDLYLQLWRGAKGDAAFLNYRPADLHWLTWQRDDAAYDEFMATGAWPAATFGDPAGLDDPADAARWYHETVAGIATTCNRLARKYAKGDGVPQDYGAAARWYRRAADQGDPAARNNLGNLYQAGLGVRQDHAEAARWYRQAAEQGDAAAQTNLGSLYHSGQGVPQSYPDAAAWFRKAAEQGSATAQYNLGVLYTSGRGVPQAAAMAAGWFCKAALQGDGEAQFNLGVMYGSGQGVSKDVVQAYVWLQLAAEQRIPDAASSRSKLAASMTPEQIAQARARIAAWKPISEPR